MSSRSDLLQKRLIAFTLAANRVARRIPRSPLYGKLVEQLAKSSMSPAGNYAEARDATSSADYAAKIKHCIKELRETAVWLAIAKGLGIRGAQVDETERECGELIAIMVTCLKRSQGSDGPFRKKPPAGDSKDSGPASSAEADNTQPDASDDEETPS